jgi:hypothetical protein
MTMVGYQSGILKMVNYYLNLVTPMVLKITKQMLKSPQDALILTKGD